MIKKILLVLILSAASTIAETKWVIKTAFGAGNEEDAKALLRLAAAGDKEGILALVKQGKCIPVERGIGGEWADQDEANGLDQVIIPNDQRNIKNPGNDAKILWIPRRFLTQTYPLPPEGETSKETQSAKPEAPNPAKATPANPANEPDAGPYDNHGNLLRSATTSAGAKPIVEIIVARMRPGTKVVSADGFFETTIGGRTYGICQVTVDPEDLPIQKAVVLYDKSTFNSSDFSVVFQLINWQQYSMFRLTNNPAFLTQ
jgi:hypothetical protein